MTNKPPKDKAAALTGFLLWCTLPFQWAAAIWWDGRWFWMSVVTLITGFLLGMLSVHIDKRLKRRWEEESRNGND